jgi:hypothetical protein
VHLSSRTSEERNLLIIHDAPQAQIHKQFINQGVVRTDPDAYLQRHMAEFDTWQSNHKQLVEEATRAVPAPVLPPAIVSNDKQYTTYIDQYRRAPSPSYIPSVSEPVFASSSSSLSSYADRYSSFMSPYDSYRGSRCLYGYDTYDHYSRHDGNYPSMVDITPSWNRRCYSSSSYYPYMSSYPVETIRVRSENEFRHVLSHLTNGRPPSVYH